MTDITPDVLSEIKNQKRSRGRPKKIDTIIREMREKALREQRMEEEEESYFDLPYIPPEKKVTRKPDMDLPLIPGKDSWTIPRIPIKKKKPRDPEAPAEPEADISESPEILETDPPVQEAEEEDTREPRRRKPNPKPDPKPREIPVEIEKIQKPNLVEPRKVHIPKPEKISADEDEEAMDSVSEVSQEKERSYAVLLPKSSFMALDLCEECFIRLKKDNSEL